MKILLISPLEKEHSSKNFLNAKFPILVGSSPLPLQQLAAVTPKKHTIEMVYERGSRKDGIGVRF